MSEVNIKQFIERWQDHGYEKGESQRFWLDLLANVFGVKNLHDYILFEQQANGKFIDARIPAAKVLIEQKSLGKDLSAAYEQAKAYDDKLPFDKKSRWIVTSDFQSFQVHDMNNPDKPPEIILLKDLECEYYRLRFLVDNTDRNIQREEEISLKVGEIVAKLYDVLKKQYHEPDSDESLNNLNKLCVRLVFCMYSESAGIFGKHKLFRDYLNKESNTRVALIRLFKVLNTPVKERDLYLEKPLSDFPYVNGNLFDDDNSVIPTITDEIRNLIVINAGRIDWSDISPTIFGAIFESTLNPATHKGGGMHYTSIENIHKLIDPLFMDDLREEFEACDTEDKLRAFQDKLASLKFFDPACGSGNFLTETYLSLRRLENDVLRKLQQLEGTLFEAPVKVSIAQFYGIEINDFAVAVAQVALWIAESQMIAETSKIIHRNLNFLPLKTNANIIEGNALRVDWNDIAPDVNYIIGNPPFAGRRHRTKEQAADIAIFFDYKDIDYVACWYKKADDFIADTKIRCAFVSTNSITQGEQVTPLWKNLHAHIDFAYKTFKWDNETTTEKAQVYCVIVGFSRATNHKPKIIFDGNQKFAATNINAYLIDAPNVFIEHRTKPICDVPEMCNGNVPLDGNALKIEAEDYADFIKHEPNAEKFIKRLIGGRELLHNEMRYVLWLVNATPHEINSMPLVMKRVALCRENRLAMKDKSTQKLAKRPTTFRDTLNPSNYIAIPMVSSGSREYIPMDYFDGETIPTNQVQIIPSATLYEFGVLNSIVHMAWTRVIAGYLGTSYRYSKEIVYNNFVWCTPSTEQHRRIEQTAQNILNVRAQFPDSSLADLYNELTMPSELRKAHRNNDRAVMEAYGFRADLSESEIVTELMKMYHLMQYCDGIDNKN